jgi:hypothetical protein
MARGLLTLSEVQQTQEVVLNETSIQLQEPAHSLNDHMQLTVLLSLYLHRVHPFSRQEHQGNNLTVTSLAGTEHETAFLSMPVPKLH